MLDNTHTTEPEVFHKIVSKIFRIDQIVLGDQQRGFFVLYKGELLGPDSEAAYDQLSNELRSYEITPAFRIVEGHQEVILVKGRRKPLKERLTINIVLFILTLLSVLFAGVLYGYQGPQPESDLELIKILLLNLWQGWPFALSLLAILLAHEFGHYFAGRVHHTAVSLPYFIPFPLNSLGTMGAFINMREIPRNKRVLFDIGVAGPLSGLAVAVPVLMIGLALSPVGKLQDTSYVSPEGSTYTLAADNGLEGNSILYLGLKYLMKGELLPAPSDYGKTPPLLYWGQYFLTGRPIPIGGRDVMLHPVAWAGWAGLLVTFLNLIPAGQLDGGHIIYTMFGRRVKIVPYMILILLVIMGFFWEGWWLWAALIFFLGRTHAQPLDQITELDKRRKIMAAVMMVIFLLVLTPIPFTLF